LRIKDAKKITDHETRNTKIMNKILLMAIGNDIRGDEGIALSVGKELKSLFTDKIDFVEVSDSGMELLAVLDDYEKVLIITIAESNKKPIGTITEFDITAVQDDKTSSSHYFGLSQILSLSKNMGIPLPEEIKIISIEIQKTNSISEEYSSTIIANRSHLLEKSMFVLNGWL
jgi:hydrogenase maturation protease